MNTFLRCFACGIVATLFLGCNSGAPEVPLQDQGDDSKKHDVRPYDLHTDSKRDAATSDLKQLDLKQLDLNQDTAVDSSPDTLTKAPDLAPDMNPPPPPLAKECSQDGWCWVNPFPHGNAFYAVWGAGPKDVFAGGQNGFIYHLISGQWATNTGLRLVRVRFRGPP